MNDLVKTSSCSPGRVTGRVTGTVTGKASSLSHLYLPFLTLTLCTLQ